MDFSPMVSEAVKVLWWVLWWVVAAAFVAVFIRSPWFKGIIGETLVRIVARLRLPARTYHRLHDVTLSTEDGTTQVDHVFVSRFGIFVVETKNMRGWIFGGESQPRWTQKIFGKTFSFQNPLRQNHKHVKALEALLDVPPEAIRSVVVFAGESTFKSPMPANVCRGGAFIGYIRSFQKPVLSGAQVQCAIERLESARLEATGETRRRHVQGLKDRLEPSEERRCPECGGSMLLRTARRGAKAGKQFWGCSSFPRCRATQDLSG